MCASAISPEDVVLDGVQSCCPIRGASAGRPRPCSLSTRARVTMSSGVIHLARGGGRGRSWGTLARIVWISRAKRLLFRAELELHAYFLTTEWWQDRDRRSLSCVKPKDVLGQQPAPDGVDRLRRTYRWGPVPDCRVPVLLCTYEEGACIGDDCLRRARRGGESPPRSPRIMFSRRSKRPGAALAASTRSIRI